MKRSKESCGYGIMGATLNKKKKIVATHTKNEGILWWFEYLSVILQPLMNKYS